MQTGTALEAPQGYGALERGCIYHFLQSNRMILSVQLVHFFRNNSSWQASLICMPRDDFERCLAQQLIIQVDVLGGQAPFLKAAEGKDLRGYDLKKTNGKRRHADLAEKRLLDISLLLEKRVPILNAPKPEALINKYAIENGFNAQRTRFFFFAYLCFGQSGVALFPHYFNCGRGERLTKSSGRKLGRPSIARGKHAGCRVDAEMAEKMVKSYKKYKEVGKPLTEIYDEAMRKTFKARTRIDDLGNKRIVSSNGSPLPTLDQYRYWLKKKIGKNTIALYRWGKEKNRRSKAAQQGTFSSSVSNLLERVEADAYYCADRPRSFLGEGHLKPLAVARLVDTASGLRIGIGFSFEKENSEAYNAALFCAVISKKKFCSLFGMDIEEAQWPSQSVPAHYITDRGPGIKREPGHEKYQGQGLAIREMTPSGQGQSKAIVEASQRRTPKLEGLAHYTASSLKVPQMIVREIQRLIKENDSADASGRMTPEMIEHQVSITPLGIWNFLDVRARNNGQLMTFDDAVRRFLIQTTVTVSRDGVRLRGQRYSSEALKESKILARISNVGRQTIPAYIYPMCVRYIWVEVNGQLIEVDAQLNLRDDEQMLYRTYEDLEMEAHQLNQLKAEHRQHSRASAIEHQIQFEQETGAPWNSGKTQRTRLKRHSATKDEEKELRAVFEGKELNNED